MPHRNSVHQALLALSDPRGGCHSSHRPALSEGDWLKLWSLAEHHGVLGWVLAHVDQQSDAKRVAHSQSLPGLGRARIVWRAKRIKTLKLRQAGDQILAALAAAAVPAALLKGADFAENLYPQPALRPTRDLDLMIPREHWPAAVRVLDGRGFKPRTRSGRARDPDRFGQESWRRAADKIAVDLHWNLICKETLRRRVATDFDSLAWQPRSGPDQPFVPTAASRLVIAATHAIVSHQFERLLHLCDLREASRAVNKTNFAELEQTLDVTGTRGIVAFALAAAARLCLIRICNYCAGVWRSSARCAGRLDSFRSTR